MKTNVAINESFRSLFDYYLTKYSPKLEVKIHVGELQFNIFSNSSILNSKLYEYFTSFPKLEVKQNIDLYVINTDSLDAHKSFIDKEPDFGKAKVKEQYIDSFDGRYVRKKLTGMSFIFGEDFHLAIGEAVQNDNQIVNFINNRYIEYYLNQNAVLGHAAGIVHEGKGISIAGFSGMGKSTLTLHLMNRGMKFVSNDRVMIKKGDEHPFMIGVPKMPRINPGTIINNSKISSLFSDEKKATYLQMPVDELWSLEEKYDLMINNFYGEHSMCLKTPLNVLVILNWYDDASNTDVQVVQLNKRQDLLDAFMKEEGLFFRAKAGRTVSNLNVSNYLDYLSNCITVEVTGKRNFVEASEKILACL